MRPGRPLLVYVLMIIVGVGAFLYPFWLPSDVIETQAHAGDAPLLAAVVGAFVVAAVTMEVRRGTMNGATIAILGVLSAIGGLLRLLDLPGGGSGIFFIVVLAGVAFGARFGLLLGLCAMAVSAIVTGGVGPWLPFQMLALGWMGGAAGLLGCATRRLGPRLEVVVLAAYGWAWGFIYGAIMNLWFWPFAVGEGDLAWRPGLSLAETVSHYRAFYVLSSFGWDAAGALTNAVLILLIGGPLLATLRRFSGRLQPVVDLGPGPRSPLAVAEI